MRYVGLDIHARNISMAVLEENGSVLSEHSSHPLEEAQVLVQRWRRHRNTMRPQSSLSYRHRERRRPNPEVRAACAW